MYSVPTKKFSSIKQILMVSSAAALLAACSSDFQRLSDYPGVDNTASLPSKTASSDNVSSSQLNGGQPSTTRPSWQTGYSNSARSTSAPTPSYTAPTYVASNETSSGGSTGTVVVQRGQTLYSIATANGMTTSQLANANNLTAPYSLKAGQRLVLPGVESPVSPAPSFRPQTVVATNSTPKAANYSANGIHQVSSGETLFAIGRTYNVHPYKIASHNNLAKPYSLSVGQKLRIPGASTANSWQQSAPTKTAVNDEGSSTVNTSAKASAPSGAASKPVEQIEEPIAKAQDSLSAGNGQFRWPVRGRVISTYGSKPGGARNEGINIAVPQGTSVKASEAGVVAYAGNELKGYGNLVLIRHEGGWVTAYAHNSELLVKRGDAVRRGQMIARAGQTGSVNSPQLHFEIRKGASAVDPLKYMSSSTASN